MVNLPNYGYNPVNIKIIAGSGREQEYTLKIHKMVPPDLLVTMRWDNTLSVINTPANNGLNAKFEEFRWFNITENRVVSTEQWWTAGDNAQKLNANHEFYVEVKTANHASYRSCPFKVTELARVDVDVSVKSFPNPVAMGQTIYIEANVDETLLKDAVIEVYNVSGNRVDYLKAQGRLTPVNVRYPAGVYVFILKGADGFTKELKVVVE